MVAKHTYILLESIVILLLVTVLLYQYSPWVQPHSSGQHSRPKLQPAIQGLYESCAPMDGNICLQRLETMAAAGFTLVVNYDQLYSTAQQELAYAQKAHSLGMKVIWAMNDPVFWNGKSILQTYHGLAVTCQCNDNTGFIRYFINLVKNLPATWGYYIGDEVKSNDYAAFNTYANQVKQDDPGHPRLFISGETSTTLGANLAPFADSADVIGSDFYPIGTTEPITSVAHVAHAVQSIANQHNKQSTMVLQAFDFAQYPDDSWVCSPFPVCTRYPTTNEMREMRDMVFTNAHPSFILWYSFFDISKSISPEKHFQSLIDAASSPIHHPS